VAERRECLQVRCFLLLLLLLFSSSSVLVFVLFFWSPFFFWLFFRGDPFLGMCPAAVGGLGCFFFFFAFLCFALRGGGSRVSRLPTSYSGRVGEFRPAWLVRETGLDMGAIAARVLPMPMPIPILDACAARAAFRLGSPGVANLLGYPVSLALSLSRVPALGLFFFHLDSGLALPILDAWDSPPRAEPRCLRAGYMDVDAI
jgi:hypothetical protein